MISALLIVVVASLVWLVGCTVWSILLPSRRIWPPRRRMGFAYRVSSVVGPGINFGLAALSVLGWNTFVLGSWLRFLVGGSLFTLGAYLGLGGYLRLGAHRSRGHDGALETCGPYRLSRNPQYAGAMLGFVGLATMCNSAPGLVTAFFACVWFVLLPFAEEPWLLEKLGPPYATYASRVPRYFSVRALCRSCGFGPSRGSGGPPLLALRVRELLQALPAGSIRRSKRKSTLDTK